MLLPSLRNIRQTLATCQISFESFAKARLKSRHMHSATTSPAYHFRRHKPCCFIWGELRIYTSRIRDAVFRFKQRNYCSSIIALCVWCSSGYSLMAFFVYFDKRTRTRPNVERNRQSITKHIKHDKPKVNISGRIFRAREVNLPEAKIEINHSVCCKILRV